MKKIYLIGLGIFLPFMAIAQYNLRPNVYYQDMLFYNPASLPEMKDADQRVLLYTQTKFIPENETSWDKGTTVLSNYLKVNEGSNTFFNVGYLFDNYSFFSRHTLYGGFGKQFSLGENSSVTFGGNLVLHSDIISWSDFQLPNDQTGSSFRVSPDVDFGAQYAWKGFKLGASVKNTISTSQEVEDLEIIRSQRAIVLNSSYDFKIKDNIQISPYILLYTELGTEIDAGVFIGLFDRVYTSYLLRVNELRSVMALEVNVYKGLSIGGSYDTSPLLPDHNVDFFARYFF